MSVPLPTLIVRLVHIDNLPLLLQREGLHAPNSAPDDGLAYKPIHNPAIQRRRRIRHIPCGPGGVIHDYAPFYFGQRPPMLLQLHTGRVQGYNEGQLLTTDPRIEHGQIHKRQSSRSRCRSLGQ